MNNPLIIITIAYILGIIIAKTINLPIIISFILILSIIVLLIWTILSKKNINYLFLTCFFLVGIINFQIRNLPPPKTDISNFPKDKFITLIGQIDDEPRFIDDKAFFTLKVVSVNSRKATGLVAVKSRIEKLEYGDKVEVKGGLESIESLANPGILSYADYLRNKGIICQLNAVRGPPKIISKGGGNPFKRISILVKNHLIVIPQKTLPEPYATLLSSIVFGSRAAKAPKEIKEVYKRAGVAHLLVASGMHLGILVGVCLFVVRGTKLPLWLGILITSTVNFLYAMMTGFGPSILRAAIMAEIMLIGLLFEREKEIYTSLSISALIILLFNPKYLFEVGFQLSFGATWSLVYVAPVIAERLKQFMPKFFSSLTSASIAPVLFSVPITLFHFSQASIIGVLTNILLLPWVGVIVILGFISTVLGAIFLPLAELINGANLVLIWIAHYVISFLGSLPFAQVFLAPPKLPIILSYYICLIGLVEVLRRGKFPKINKFRIVIVILAIFSVFFWNIAFSDNQAGLIITVLDVGQGDSILIESPGGKKVLVDGGKGKMGERVVLVFLRKKGISKLDMVVLTHPHEDHVGGLLPVLEGIKVDSVLDPGFVYKSHSYKRFMDLVEKNKIKYCLGCGGQMLNFGGGVEVQILHPTSPFLAETNSDANNVSIVFRLQYGNFSMMFTGDNEHEGEKRILEIFPEASLASTILKLGHHGSGTSTSIPFLEAVSPKVGIICCGKHNKFRHPHKQTLEKLKSRSIKLYRTDEDGAIVIKTDGKTYNIKTSK